MRRSLCGSTLATIEVTYQASDRSKCLRQGHHKVGANNTNNGRLSRVNGLEMFPNAPDGLRCSNILAAKYALQGCRYWTECLEVMDLLKAMELGVNCFSVCRRITG